LLLAAGELVRLAPLVAREIDELERGTDPPRDVGLRDRPPLEPERDVVADVEVGNRA
jgi:hypothetical protein